MDERTSRVPASKGKSILRVLVGCCLTGMGLLQLLGSVQAVLLEAETRAIFGAFAFAALALASGIGLILSKGWAWWTALAFVLFGAAGLGWFGVSYSQDAHRDNLILFSVLAFGGAIYLGLLIGLLIPGVRPRAELT